MLPRDDDFRIEDNMHGKIAVVTIGPPAIVHPSSSSVYEQIEDVAHGAAGRDA